MMIYGVVLQEEGFFIFNSDETWRHEISIQQFLSPNIGVSEADLAAGFYCKCLYKVSIHYLWCVISPFCCLKSSYSLLA